MTTATETYTWIPNPRQAQVLRIIAEQPLDTVALIGYGGAAGGAKTNLLANLAIELALQVPGCRLLIGRQDFIDLKTTTLAEFDRACPPGLDVVRYESAPVYRDVRASADQPYSRIYFRGLDDWQSLMSEEYGWILIDEAHQVRLQAVLGLMSRLRHRPERKWGIVVGYNPWPSWCVEWFNRGKLPKEIKDSEVIQTHFVQSRATDNPYLPDVYVEVLRANPDPIQRAILLEGDADAASDTSLYFNRQALEAGQLLCAEPAERRDTRVEPGAMPDGHVLIWEKPLTAEHYYIGADTADGKGEVLEYMGEFSGPDRNAAAIYRARDNVQVAAIYGRQEEHQFARLLNEYGRWYNMALLGVERNRRSVLVALRELSYPNLYYVQKPVDMHIMAAGVGQAATRRLEFGWNTDLNTRPVMLADLNEAITMRAIRPRDSSFFDEAMNFLRRKDQDADKGHPEAGNGYHDDRIFAHAIAWQVRKALRQGQQRRGPRMLEMG